MVTRALPYTSDPARVGKRAAGWIGYAIFIALGFATLLPIFWMVSTSLNSNRSVKR